MITDTHTHLYSEQFDEDRAEMIQRAKDAGITRFFIPAIDSSYTDSMIDLDPPFKEDVFLPDNRAIFCLFTSLISGDPKSGPLFENPDAMAFNFRLYVLAVAPKRSSKFVIFLLSPLTIISEPLSKV